MSTEYVVGRFMLHDRPPRHLLTTLATQQEETLAIEYTEVMPEPEHKQDLPHDDWVACVAAGGNPYVFNVRAIACCGCAVQRLTTTDGRRYIVSGSFDQQARMWNAEGECVAVLSGHTGPVKGVAWMSKRTPAHLPSRDS